jgi:hypothetical protein
MIDRIRPSPTPVGAVSFHPMARMLMAISALASEHKAIVTANVVVPFGPEVVPAERGSLGMYATLYHCSCD